MMGVSCFHGEAVFSSYNVVSKLDECCIQITPYKYRTDLVLECVCRSNECTGNKQWTGGPMDTTLTLNNHVSVGMESKLQILVKNSFNYSILINEATIDDWSSNYTCNFGTLSKHISLDGYYQSKFYKPTYAKCC